LSIPGRKRATVHPPENRSRQRPDDHHDDTITALLGVGPMIGLTIRHRLISKNQPIDLGHEGEVEKDEQATNNIQEIHNSSSGIG